MPGRRRHLGDQPDAARDGAGDPADRRDQLRDGVLVATASSRIVKSNARRVLAASTPVSGTTARTASKIRSGALDTPSRRRQYVNVVGWNAAAVTANPHAAFHRRSNVTASAASRSDNPCNACSTSTAATTGPATLGRPRPDGNKSANITSGNSTSRWSAKKANTLPAGSR